MSLASLIAACTGCTALKPAPVHGIAGTAPASVASAAPAPVTSTPPATGSPGTARPHARHHRAVAAHRPVPYGIGCQPAALQLGLGQRLSQATSQETLLFTLTNVSAAGCDLDGYPGVNLLSAGGRVLPFHIHWGSDQMLTKARPALVPLAPGRTAYFATSKWVCVRHSYSAGRYLQVIPPGDYQVLPAIRLRYHGVTYCRAGDPGNTVDVSPVEPSQVSVFGLHN